MLIKFRSQNSAEFVMFGEVALQLIALMGHGGSVPGAIAADDVPAALARLQQALTAAPAPPAANTTDKADDSGERKVGLQQRAAPLLAMLSHAITAKSYVMWDK